MRPLVSNSARPSMLLGVVLVVLGLEPRSAGAEPQTPFRVETSPGATCPSGEPFAAQLLRRTDRVREAVGDEPAVVFRLEATTNDTRTSGRLTVREIDGSELERDVAGASCQEVVSAMVLIAAILLDPNASLDPLPAQEPPPPPRPAPPRSTAPADPPPPGEVIPAGQTLPPGAIVRPRAAVEQEQRRTPPGERSASGRRAPGEGSALGRLRAGGGVGFALEGAPMPKAAAGVAVAGMVSLERRSILSPLLEGSGVRTQTVSADTPSGRAEFQFASLRLLACPVRFPAESLLTVRPCVLGELGELIGIGKVTEDPAAVEARWVALGGAVRASARLVGPLVLVGQGAVVVPLIRHEFYFDPRGPETTALEVRAAGLSGRLSVVAEFE